MFSLLTVFLLQWITIDAVPSSFPKQPNILLIVTDQERAAPHYESPEIKTYRSTFNGRNKIAGNGMSFNHHYIASSACVPSRTCLYTGQSIHTHGVSQTDGIAKGHSDPNFQWLPPQKGVPTIGEYLSVGGYDTSYVGKWHISQEDEPDPTSGIVEDVIPRRDPSTNNTEKDDDPSKRVENKVKDLYLQSNKLKKYGFDDWVGPDPHGKFNGNAPLPHRKYSSS